MRPVLGGRYAVGGDDEHAVFMDKPAELLGAVNGTGTERQVVQVVGIVLLRVDAGDAQLLKQFPGNRRTTRASLVSPGVPSSSTAGH